MFWNNFYLPTWWELGKLLQQTSAQYSGPEVQFTTLNTTNHKIQQQNTTTNSKIFVVNISFLLKRKTSSQWQAIDSRYLHFRNLSLCFGICWCFLVICCSVLWFVSVSCTSGPLYRGTSSICNVLLLTFRRTWSVVYTRISCLKCERTRLL